MMHFYRFCRLGLMLVWFSPTETVSGWAVPKSHGQMFASASQWSSVGGHVGTLQSRSLLLMATSAESSATQEIDITRSLNVVDSSAATNTTTTTIPKRASFPVEQLKVSLSVVIATMVTFAMNNLFSLGPVRASGTIGLLAAILLPEKLALSALCGTFAGMAKLAVIPSYGMSLWLGVACARILALFDKMAWAIGVGGRLGFVAQCACTMHFALLAILSSDLVKSAALVGSPPSLSSLVQGLPVASFFCLVGAAFMTFWKEAMIQKAKRVPAASFSKMTLTRLASSTAAVSATGLIGSLMPAHISAAVYCGSFVAMASPARLPTYGSLLSASLLSGIWIQAMQGILVGGWGGKLGTAAFGGVLSHIGIRNLISTQRRLKAGST